MYLLRIAAGCEAASKKLASPKYPHRRDCGQGAVVPGGAPALFSRYQPASGLLRFELIDMICRCSSTGRQPYV
jgi:hypothetical protein